MMGIIAFLVLIFILSYILSRVWRYRQKYKKTFNEFIEMEKKEDNLKQKMTTFKGESVMDSEQNMIFTDNPCKDCEIKGDENQKKKLLIEMEALEDSHFNRLKKLESNNDKLGTERDNLIDRLEKLREYHILLKAGNAILYEK